MLNAGVGGTEEFFDAAVDARGDDLGAQGAIVKGLLQDPSLAWCL